MFMNIMAAADVVDFATFSDVLEAITGQINVAGVVGILAGALGIAIGFVFLWWAVRKVLGIILNAFKKGKAKV